MIYKLFGVESYSNSWFFFSVIATFLVTILAIHLLQNALPHDGGREFAVNGELSKGKPRGAGIIFVISFIVMSVLFVPMDTNEYYIYCILIAAAMLSGFLDDKADVPWNEYKKGIIDFAIAIMTAVTFTNYNSDLIGIMTKNNFIELPKIVYIILATILIWVSINVTNCSDGVDGLCGSLSVITLFSFFFMFFVQGLNYSYMLVTMIAIASILGYLWFNISPSKLLMGDAGSRAIGFFIAVLSLKCFNPLLFVLFAFVLIVDGGLGLIKVSLLRFLKIAILKNTRTPIHDHERKNKGWSDSQVVFKFSVIQIIVSFFAISFFVF